MELPGDEAHRGWHEIRDVYYRDGGSGAYSGVASTVLGDNLDELRCVLDRMREALDKPVLTPRDFPDATRVSDD